MTVAWVNGIDVLCPILNHLGTLISVFPLVELEEALGLGVCTLDDPGEVSLSGSGGIGRSSALAMIDASRGAGVVGSASKAHEQFECGRTDPAHH